MTFSDRPGADPHGAGSPPVHDTDGNKIGEAKRIFLDDTTGWPEWVSVKTGLFGTSESSVPIRDASLVEDHLEVPYPKDKVKDAPNVDAGGHLSEDEEHRLSEHYGMVWGDAWQQANEPGEGGWAHTDTDGTTSTSRMAGTGTDEMTSTSGAAGTPTGMGLGADADGGDDAMTRSEERTHVGTERYEAGRARLRTYVVTEEVQQTVPVRREEVRVEREPITDANREAALSGPDITEAEHEVVLHEERPVTQTEAVPVERVRMTTEERTDEETVRGQVRKEEIGTEGVEEQDGRRGVSPLCLHTTPARPEAVRGGPELCAGSSDKRVLNCSVRGTPLTPMAPVRCRITEEASGGR